MLDVQGRQFIC